MNLEHEVVEIWQTFIVPACSVVGTLVVILVGFARYKDHRMENALEAGATWRELALSRDGKIDDLEQQLKECQSYSRRLERRNEYLWSKLDPAAKETVRLYEGP